MASRPPRGYLLDSGVLIALDRGQREAQIFAEATLRSDKEWHTTEPVISQVWRGGARQARLARFLRGIKSHPFTEGRRVGQLLGRSNLSDSVDAHLVVVARAFDLAIVTGDVGDLRKLAESLGTPQPKIIPWPMNTSP